MRYKLMVVACAFASTAAAQLGDYLGPGVLTHGASDIGNRAGQQVSLRLFADLSATYDNGVQPIALDSTGNLEQVNGLYGIDLAVGAYGVHVFRRAQLGLDYHGDFRHYFGQSSFDGSDHQLILGYTYQRSKRLYFDLQELAGTVSQTVGGLPGLPIGVPSVVDQPVSLLFNSRMYFSESSATATYLLTARTSMSVGGEGYLVRRQSTSLLGMNGYDLRGSLNHRVSRVTSIGVSYDHQHFDYPGQYGQADINGYQGTLATQFSKRWTFSLQAGVYQTEIQGVQLVALDPAIAAILGISSTPQTFYKASLFPTGTVNLTRRFKTASFNVQYARGVSPGNGVYLTSRTESGSASYSYTGIRKATLSVTGGEYTLIGVGQNLGGYRQWSGGAGATYNVFKTLHLTAHYDAREQSIDSAGFRRTSYRVMLGIAFSPGTLPLSLW